MNCKQAIEVTVVFSPEGLLTPTRFVLETGEMHEIDRVLERRPGCSLKHGVLGMRYKCKIGAQTAFFVLEHDKWYLDS